MKTCSSIENTTPLGCNEAINGVSIKMIIKPNKRCYDTDGNYLGKWKLVNGNIEVRK